MYDEITKALQATATKLKQEADRLELIAADSNLRRQQIMERCQELDAVFKNVLLSKAEAEKVSAETQLEVSKTAC